MVTAEQCRAEGLSEATIESMRLKGFFHRPSPLAEARAEVRDEIEALDADLIGMLEELREVRERIAEARARRAELVARYKGLRSK